MTDAAVVPWGRSLATGAAAGIASIATASFVTSWTSADGPLAAVATRVIDLAPTRVKHWAIETFGTSDKLVLGVGIAVILWLLAAAMARSSRRYPAVVPAGLAVFAAVGVASPAHPGTLVVIATLLGVAVAWGVFRLLIPLGSTAAPVPVADSAEPSTDERPRAQPMPRNRWEAPVDRRQFMARAAAISGGGAALGAASLAVTRNRDVQIRKVAGKLPKVAPGSPDAAAVVTPGATADPGVTPFVTPNADFYKIDTTFLSPRVDLDSWRLKIHGRVDHPLELTFDDLASRHVVERYVTLCCVSNEVGGTLIGNARWLGVPLAELLDEVRPHGDASQIAMTSVDGWTCGFPTELARDGRDALVAIGMNGEPLPIDHGFPVRIVVPGLYGYVSATKWVSDIELTTLDDFDGYWISRGWSKDGPVKTQSRIDVPADGAELRAGRQAIAGIAWAQHRGITKVEVRVDGGPFETARLADGVSADTWRQWVHEWDATPGSHTIQVRATDGKGRTQTEDEAPPEPDGATGWHTIRVDVDVR